MFKIQAHTPWEGFIYAAGGYANVDGFAQTPKGGTMGTTSFLRPTFEETHFHHETLIDVGGGFKYDTYFLILNYLKLAPKGNALLTEDLITHAQFISSGSPFEMKIQYDWIQLSFGKDFYFQNSAWQCSPFLSTHWIVYRYDFVSTDTQSKRHFSMMALTAGLQIQYYFNTYLWIDASVEATLPINNVSILNGTIGFNRQIALTSHFTLMPRIGLSGFRLDYEDNQSVPNHIRYTAKPYLNIGAAIKVT